MSNSFAISKLIQSIGIEIKIIDKATSRYLKTNIIQVSQEYLGGKYTFSMTKYLVLNPSTTAVIFESEWQLIPHSHNLPLNGHEIDFNHLINKNYPRLLNGNNSDTVLNNDELDSCLQFLIIDPYLNNYPNQNELSIQAHEALNYILDNLDHIRLCTSPSIANCCEVEIRLYLKDVTFFCMSYSYMMDSFEELVPLRKPEFKKIFQRRLERNNSEEVKQNFKEDLPYAFNTEDSKPNCLFENDVLHDVFNWVFSNRLDLCLHLQTAHPIAYNQIKNRCGRGF